MSHTGLLVGVTLIAPLELLATGRAAVGVNVHVVCVEMVVGIGASPAVHLATKLAGVDRSGGDAFHSLGLFMAYAVYPG